MAANSARSAGSLAPAGKLPTMAKETWLVMLEGLLVFGGALAFGIWQLRSIKKDQEKARQAAKESTSDDSNP